MALTSTLFTGLSGLNVNQTRLNVVGNNIANVNTVAFKGSRALFKPQFYVTDAAGSPPSADFGGTNPSQRGLGASVSAIEKSWAPGSIESTGHDTDLAIDGDGFFILKGKEQKFTRDGSFTLNQDNKLVNSTGDFVQGFGVDGNQHVITGALDRITIPLGKLTKADATTAATFVGNLNAGGPLATGASVLSSQAMVDNSTGIAPTAASRLIDLRDTAGGDFITSGATLMLNGSRGGRDIPALTLTVDGATSVQDLQNFLAQGMAIDTSVAGPVGYTPGVTLVPDATGATAQLFVTGNAGLENKLEIPPADLVRSDGLTTFAFSGAPTNAPIGESVYTSVRAYDSLGNPLTVNLTAVMESKQDTGTTWRYFAYSADDTDAKSFDPTAASHPGSVIGTGTIDFDPTGKLLTLNEPVISIDRKNTGSGTPLSISLDFSSMTALSATNSKMIGSSNGQPIGTLANFSIGANGIITGSFDNGLTTTLGQVAIATFDNKQGLVDKGGNNYIAGPDSGVPKIAAPLDLGGGAIRAGALEASNVDLSAEFINLIIASTGFSASSRVITTSNQLITELLNTSR